VGCARDRPRWAGACLDVQVRVRLAFCGGVCTCWEFRPVGGLGKPARKQTVRANERAKTQQTTNRTEPTIAAALGGQSDAVSRSLAGRSSLGGSHGRRRHSTARTDGRIKARPFPTDRFRTPLWHGGRPALGPIYPRFDGPDNSTAVSQYSGMSALGHRARCAGGVGGRAPAALKSRLVPLHAKRRVRESECVCAHACVCVTLHV
jgi:hypothetical protein